MAKLKLTVVTPVFNEEQVIAHFYARTRAVLDTLAEVESHILFVVDRCTDNTLDVLREIIARDPRAKALALSSRFGHQMSLLAGIESACDADVIVMMDSDLQHPPELIPELLSQYRQGMDVVYTIRRETDGIGLIRRTLGNLFYRLMGTLSRVPINANAADFRLISRRVAQTLSTDFSERNMFLRGLFSWIGFRQVSVEFTAERRFAGESKYSLSQMLRLAMAGILSFSTRPLHFGIFLGVGFAALAFLYLIVSVVTYFVNQSIPSGWTTLVALSLLFSGVQLIVLGIMGAYIGGIYEEVKGRPRYIIEEEINYHD
ncbi:MAG: glycosyltransferase family 2 protein [Candidatus Competibacteraceae bacterium]